MCSAVSFLCVSLGRDRVLSVLLPLSVTWGRVGARQVFGKVLVARSMDAALAASREFGTDAVTLDGDCFSRKGSVTGGFQDGRRKRLATMKKVKELRRRHGELQELITNIRNSRDGAFLLRVHKERMHTMCFC